MALCAMPMYPQGAKHAHSPAAIQSRPLIVLDSVVTEQWPASLEAVNVPDNIVFLNPGQCVRVGVAAVGDGFEHFLDGMSISYSVRAGDKYDDFPVQPAAASKLIKPDGGDFVTGALATAGIKNPLESTGSLAVSAARWCVPLDAAEGTARVTVNVTLNNKTRKLDEVSVQIESLGAAAAKSFKHMQELGSWMDSYHSHPEPGRLIAAVKLVAADHDENPNGLEFLKAAFAHDAATAKALGPYIAKMDKLPKMVSLVLLKNAGVQLIQPPVLSEDDEEFLKKSAALPDPYNMAPGTKLWMNLDLLWADFIATGRKEPIVAITRTLAWKSDYDAFAQMQKEGKRPTELTDSLIRGLTYSAAGWSLSSFDNNDPLAADYIQSILADPGTPSQIQEALKSMHTNSAFRHDH